MEALIARINAAGYRVCNLFQLDGYWRCNLCTEDRHYEWANGATAAEALTAALALVEEDPFA